MLQTIVHAQGVEEQAHALRPGARMLRRHLPCVLLCLCALVTSFRTTCALGKTSPDGPDTGGKALPGTDVLAEAATRQAQKLGLLAGAADIAEFRSRFAARVSPSAFMSHSGAWDVVFEDEDNQEVLSICVSSGGGLLAFTSPWRKKQSLGAKRQLTFQQALDATKNAVAHIRGAFPEDLSIESAEFVPSKEFGGRREAIPGTPRWVFRWRKYDGRIRYEYSWIEVSYSSHVGLISYQDHYNARNTRHKANVEAQSALESAQQVIDERVKAMREHGVQATAGRTKFDVDPVAFVWDVPGDKGDFLVYTITWETQWLDDVSGSEPVSEELVIHIDTTTGKPPNLSLKPQPDAPFQAPENPAEAPEQAAGFGNEN